jgi:hypothetical protein
MSFRGFLLGEASAKLGFGEAVEVFGAVPDASGFSRASEPASFDKAPLLRTARSDPCPPRSGRVRDAGGGESRLVGKLDRRRGIVCRLLLIHKEKHDGFCFVWLKDKLHFLRFSGARRFGTKLVGPAW